MSSEFEKIFDYFGEAERLWESNPEMVVSRQFFELWQSTTQPKPFVLESPTIELAEAEVSLPDEPGTIAYFDWHEGECCACMRVEGESFEQQLLLHFQDGAPIATEQPLELLEDYELPFGERLEMMYDVVAYVRENQPGRDLTKLTRRAFQSILKVVGSRYSKQAVAVMKGLRLGTIKKLMARALEDLPRDEWTNQLTLPLDGSYAAPAAASAITSAVDEQAITIHLPPRTSWNILGDLRFIQAACLALADLDDSFVISFYDAEVLDETRDGYVLKIPAVVPPNISIGERLKVFVRGERGSVAMLYIDHLERDHVFGRFSWNDITYGELDRERFYAKPRSGGNAFLAGMINSIVQDFTRKGTLASPGVEAALGVRDAPFEDVGAGRVLEEMDHSQARAWHNAVHEENPVMLIQGPPGTGKTHVLELVVRELCDRGQRILITAPSNTAVDNVCKRISDLPVLRVGNDRDSIDPKVAAACWTGEMDAVQRVAALRKQRPGAIYAGTHVGLLRDEVIAADAEQQGPFDVIIFDEAGMARMDEFILCGQRAKRLILFGDHQQLPPFPLPDEILHSLEQQGPFTRPQWQLLKSSALEWLVRQRGFPVFLLQASYRCQNPRLMRFSSTLFYDARVRPSHEADYYQLSFEERQKTYPPATLRIFRTSSLPAHIRHERFAMDNNKPGVENELEARLCILSFGELVRRYPPEEITIIVPYRRQLQLLRGALSLPVLRSLTGRDAMTEAQRRNFVHTRVSTVDSFQGGESDAVIVSYVRSNDGRGIGFVDDPQRVNVAYTRCRRELIIIGDLECLKRNATNHIFERLERAVSRDGQIIDITEPLVDKLPKLNFRT